MDMPSEGAGQQQSGGNTTPANPQTADASVIVMALVGCAALSGITVFRKKKTV